MHTEYLPKTLELNWKYVLLKNGHNASLLSKINLHTSNIVQICQHENRTRYPQLYDEKFWTELKLQGQGDVEQLYRQWKQIEPLAHLNTKQLLHLIQEEIDPLIAGYQLILFELNNNSNNLNFLPDFLKASRRSVLDQIQCNLDKIATLKQHIFTGLLARVETYKALNATRQVDDVLASFAHKINEMKLPEVSLEISEPYTATLDDNRRLTIYDLFKRLQRHAKPDIQHFLKAIHFNEKILNAIIEPIPGKAHQIFLTKEEIQQEKKDIERFKNRVLESLNLSRVDEILKPSPYTPNSIVKFVNALWRFRYVAYMLGCFLAYQYIMALLSPLVLMPFGVSVFSTVSTVLFYTLGIAPVWHMLWKKVHQHFTDRKRSEILESLIILEDTQRFIANRLAQTPLDLIHYDIAELMHLVDGYSTQLIELKQRISRINFVENRFCQGNIKSQTENVKNRIDRQLNLLQDLVKRLAQHISERIKNEIENIESDLTHNQLVLVVDQHAIAKLRQFVVQHGDEKSLQLFDLNSNITNRWANNIGTFSLNNNRTEQHRFNQPWGTKYNRVDLVKGWDLLLSTFIINESQREAALAINNMLAGRASMSQADLEVNVNQLVKGKDAEHLLQQIQSHLFNTLSVRATHDACLLSIEQKNLITEWYQNNKIDIDLANSAINKIFNAVDNKKKLNKLLSKYSEEELAQFYELLDGADFAGAIADSLRQYQSKNRVRKFFDSYDGESNRGYQFIKFIPDCDKPIVALSIAKKRLHWLLGNLNLIDVNNPFEEEDIMIFKNLWVQGKFNFTEEIQSSSIFKNPPSDKMKAFLISCSRNGLGKAALLLNTYDPNVDVKKRSFLRKHVVIPKLQTELQSKNKGRRHHA